MEFDLSHVVATLEKGNLDQLRRLDRHGWILGPAETFEAFKARLTLEAEAHRKMQADLSTREGFAADKNIQVTEADRIPRELLAEAGKVTRKLYGFEIDWAPGFFVGKGVGALWGGCAWHDPEKHLTMFLIRENFRHSPKYLVYSRKELIAHELCHVGRGAFGHDGALEEFYAYRTSESGLRRYLGNCFSGRFDALWFLGPTLLLLLAQIVNVFFMSLPLWPFWFLLVLGMGTLLWRNHCSRKYYFSARQNLRKWLKQQAQAILYRSTFDEVKTIAGMKSGRRFKEWAERRAREELRWRVIYTRFIADEFQKKCLNRDQENER